MGDIIRFKMGEKYSFEERKDTFYLTNHPLADDIKMVHFKRPNGMWDVVMYPNVAVDKSFDDKTWVRVD